MYVNNLGTPYKVKKQYQISRILTFRDSVVRMYGLY